MYPLVLVMTSLKHFHQTTLPKAQARNRLWQWLRKGKKRRRVILTQIPRWASRGWHMGLCTSTHSSSSLSCQSSLRKTCSMLEMLLPLSLGRGGDAVLTLQLDSKASVHDHRLKVPVPLSGLVNNMGQSSMSGLEGSGTAELTSVQLNSLVSLYILGLHPVLLFLLSHGQALLQAGTVRVTTDMGGLTTQI